MKVALLQKKTRGGVVHAQISLHFGTVSTLKNRDVLGSLTASALMEVVGDAYAISSNYLRRTGAIADDVATDERLLQIVVRMFHRGEINKLKLANKAIAEFEARAVV